MLEAPIITKIKENKQLLIKVGLGLLAFIILLTLIFSGGDDSQDQTPQPKANEKKAPAPLWEEQPDSELPEAETPALQTVQADESTYVEPPVAQTQEGTTFQSYTVVKGDSLTKIAKEFYGAAHYWTQIFNKNKEKIKDPDLIRIGQEILVPVRSDGNLSWDKKLLVDAYIETYKSYRKQEKLSEVYWMLSTGVKRLAPELVTYYFEEVKKFDRAFARGELSSDAYPKDKGFTPQYR